MTVPSKASAGDWNGWSLGERTIGYTDRDAILYALAVGARRDELDLVFEERLRVLPGFGLTLAQWAPDILSEAGAFDGRAVHGSQTLRVLRSLPRSGEIRMSSRVGDVWDKGSAAVFDVVVESDYFEAVWTIFAPGVGGFGGERGPGRPVPPALDDVSPVTVATATNQALLYRLLGDRHHIHVDPDASARIGQSIPILHGLCTLAAVTLPIARAIGAHPADLLRLDGRFSAPVIPGDTLYARYRDERFEVEDEKRTVISDGVVTFG